MAKGYWIAHIDVTDMEGFRDYFPMSTRAVEESGGRFLVRGESAEGDMRQAHSAADLTIVEGFE